MAERNASILADEPSPLAAVESDAAPGSTAARARYQPPVLVVYGSLQALTSLTGNTDDDGIIGTGAAT